MDEPESFFRSMLELVTFMGNSPERLGEAGALSRALILATGLV